MSNDHSSPTDQPKAERLKKHRGLGGEGNPEADSAVGNVDHAGVGAGGQPGAGAESHPDRGDKHHGLGRRGDPTADSEIVNVDHAGVGRSGRSEDER